jgi:hypothetical protein
VTRAALALLLLAGCGSGAPEPPTMAPVDTVRARPAAVPKAAKAECEMPAWEPITLPTTAAEQVAGRHADRAKAEAVIAECERRRSSAVRAIRRGAAR